MGIMFVTCGNAEVAMWVFANHTIDQVKAEIAALFGIPSHLQNHRYFDTIGGPVSFDLEENMTMVHDLLMVDNGHDEEETFSFILVVTEQLVHKKRLNAATALVFQPNCMACDSWNGPRDPKCPACGALPRQPIEAVNAANAEGKGRAAKAKAKSKAKRNAKDKAKGKALKPKNDDDGKHAEDVHGKAKAKAKAKVKNKGKAKAKAKGEGRTEDNPQGLCPWQSPKRYCVYASIQ